MSLHPNVHREWSEWSDDQVLHVIAPYINPFRYRTRRQLFHDFIKHMKAAPNVRLHVVEVAFGERPFEVSGVDDVQLRSKHVLWQKENAINIGIQRLPADWKYAAYVDGDFHFTRYDWALEAVHMLQHHPWVQLFSSYAHMSLDHRILQNRPSFAYAYHKHYGGRPATHPLRSPGAIENYNDLCGETISRILNTTPGATGGAWAFTREGFSSVSGMLDTCILGAADWYMAFGMVGNKADGHPEAVSCGVPYEQSIRRWQDRAFAAVQGNIGYIENFCVHHWHGDIARRGYGERWKILRDHQFDPLVDVIKDSQGLLAWPGNKPQLQADISRYFVSRSEDSTECSIRPLI